MKTLLYHFMPFSLAHGGQQIQILRTAEALRMSGVEIEFLNWHDDSQRGDILHFFGRMPPALMQQAKLKGMKVVVADLLAAQGARPNWRITAETLGRRFLERVLARDAGGALSWITYRQADACVALTSWEGELLQKIFAVAKERIAVIPNGVDPVFLERSRMEREPWLLSVGTIAPVKRSVEIAHAAVLARTPIAFVGRPYSSSDPYFKQFTEIVQSQPQWLRHDGEISDRSQLARRYQSARGFVLLSRWESLSLAALEAAGCGCSLLLSDLPWARSAFKGQAIYCPARASIDHMASHLRAFYDACPGLAVPKPPISWTEVGARTRELYCRLLA
jgi:glycosyltransferase involved in cell wall biosynthesis